MRRAVVCLVVSGLSGAAGAQINPIGPFTGNAQESFEAQSGTALMCAPNRILNNQGDLCTPAGTGVYMTSGWSFTCQIGPHAGSRFCGTGGATGSGGIDITFDMPPQRFGGYFGMNHSGGPDFNVSFYQGANLVSGPVSVSLAVDCQWHWFGWDLSGSGVDRIHLSSNHTSTGYLHMDDLEADFITCVQTYGHGCTGTGGFVPQLSAPSCPVAGGNMTVDVAGGLGGATAFLLLGGGPTEVNLGLGCTLNVTPVFPAITSFPLGGVGPGNGAITLIGPIPAAAAGFSLVAQVFVVDAGVVKGYSNSPGLQLTIQ